MLTRRNWLALALIVALGLAVFWLLSMPQPLRAADIPQHKADPVNGERLYHAAGCVSCHLPSPDLKGVDASVPAGGAPLVTPVGTLYPMNLTPDSETGIGKWSDRDFLNAVQRGIAPDGEHLVPALPYTSYVHMKPEDVLDIRAYLATLPPVKSPQRAAEIPAEAFVRRGIGLWKLLGFDTSRWKPDPSRSDSWNHGSYLVNGPGHCQECHTPRNAFMVPDQSRAFAGGAHPEGNGRVPSLRGLVERGRYTGAADLATALKNGEAMGYDHLASGGMGQVQRNISHLPEPDIQAIADYVASLK